MQRRSIDATKIEALPLESRIVAILSDSTRQRLNYHSLMLRLWPPEQHPKAWRYSSNGGPPGCAIAFGRALGRMRRQGDIYELCAAGRGEICLSLRRTTKRSP